MLSGSDKPIVPASLSVTSGGRLAELDALRGIGAIGVILYHFTSRFPATFPQADHVPFAFWPGEYRVLLFFVISGFAIFFSLRHVQSVPDFAINRFARLFPCYWLAIIITLMVEWIGGADQLLVSVTSALINFSMLQDYFYVPAVDGAYWTLTFELGFYVCMIAIWRMLGRNMVRLEWALLFWLVLKNAADFWGGVPFRLSTLLVLDYVPFFVIGMLFHRIWSRHRSWRQQLPFLVAALATVLLADGPVLFYVACGLSALCAMMLAGWLRFICFGPLIWLGQLSYPLYLVHENVGFVVMLQSEKLGWNHWVGFGSAISVALALAFVLHHYVEQPCNRRIMDWWKSRKSQAGYPSAG